jgi:hypothetical protein
LIIQKLDRTCSTSGNLFQNKEDVFYYLGMSKEEIAKVFAYLTSVSFNYPLGDSPKLDKDAFSMREN